MALTGDISTYDRLDLINNLLFKVLLWKIDVTTVTCQLE